MPLHSVQHLSSAAVLGLWHLTEAPPELWALLPHPAVYEPLLPHTADVARLSQWLAGRVLAHQSLQEFADAAPNDLVLHNDSTGRPWLAGNAPGLSVSLSHSGEWVAAMLGKGARVGVDVEIVRDKAQRLASKFLAPPEWAAAQAATEAAAPEACSAHYTLLWSAKETLYKLAAQSGLIFKTQLLLNSFPVQQSGEIPATLVLGSAETRHCICYTRPAPGYVLTYSHQPAA